MKYPTIDQYIDALDNAHLFVKSLTAFTLPKKWDGEPIYSSGNFGVVFQACNNAGELFAIKCFTRSQLGRQQAYHRISQQLPRSNYLIDIDYHPGEILIAPYGSNTLTPFDVITMKYIEGETLCTKVNSAVENNDTATLKTLSKNFDTMALWLLKQSFAHGDIKPQNIMVMEDLSLKLVDYDGMFIPQMAGESQREIGTESFQHPLRCSMAFDKHIDDYSIALLSLTLRAISADTEVYKRFCITPSEMIISPIEAISGNSMPLKYIEQFGYVDKELIALIKSPSGVLDNLQKIIQRHWETKNIVHNCNNKELIPIKIGDKWGYANKNGSITIDALWDEVTEFISGRSRVRKESKWGYLQSDGNMITRLIFDFAFDFSNEGLALICKGGKYGYIGTNGKIAIPARYHFASSFSEGYAVAALDGKYGYIDTKGEWVLRPTFEFCRPIRGGVGIVEYQGQECSLNIDSVVAQNKSGSHKKGRT